VLETALVDRRRTLWIALALVAAIAVGVPVVLAVDPTPGPGTTESAKPGRGPKSEGAKAPKVEVTLRGTIQRTTDDRGRPTFTLTSGGTTYELSAGPKWFHGTDGGPLATYVGKDVEVHGWQREGSTDVSVDAVDGTRIVPAGRPAWAGGPKTQGERHPGWKPWHATGKHSHGLGREGAPGQLKDRPADDEATPGG